MAWVSGVLGWQPDPDIAQRRCADCNVLACDEDGRPWRNSIRLVTGERRTICENCAAFYARYPEVIDTLHELRRKEGVAR